MCLVSLFILLYCIQLQLTFFFTEEHLQMMNLHRRLAQQRGSITNHHQQLQQAHQQAAELNNNNHEEIHVNWLNLNLSAYNLLIVTRVGSIFS